MQKKNKIGLLKCHKFIPNTGFIQTKLHDFALDHVRNDWLQYGDVNGHFISCNVAMMLYEFIEKKAKGIYTTKDEAKECLKIMRGK